VGKACGGKELPWSRDDGPAPVASLPTGQNVRVNVIRSKDGTVEERGESREAGKVGRRKRGDNDETTDPRSWLHSQRLEIFESMQFVVEMGRRRRGESPGTHERRMGEKSCRGGEVTDRHPSFCFKQSNMFK
jgi:hypothetical protein